MLIFLFIYLPAFGVSPKASNPDPKSMKIEKNAFEYLKYPPPPELSGHIFLELQKVFFFLVASPLPQPPS